MAKVNNAFTAGMRMRCARRASAARVGRRPPASSRPRAADASACTRLGHQRLPRGGGKSRKSARFTRCSAASQRVSRSGSARTAEVSCSARVFAPIYFPLRCCSDVGLARPSGVGWRHGKDSEMTAEQIKMRVVPRATRECMLSVACGLVPRDGTTFDEM